VNRLPIEGQGEAEPPPFSSTAIDLRAERIAVRRRPNFTFPDSCACFSIHGGTSPKTNVLIKMWSIGNISTQAMTEDAIARTESILFMC